MPKVNRDENQDILNAETFVSILTRDIDHYFNTRENFDVLISELRENDASKTDMLAIFNKVNSLLNKQIVVFEHHIQTETKPEYIELFRTQIANLKLLIGFIKELPELYVLSNKNKKPIKRETLGLFCFLIDKLEIIKKKHKSQETIAVFCERVCIEFGFNYTDRVSKHFYEDKAPEAIENLKTEILQNITDTQTIEKFNTYLNNLEQKI